jgi:hypothetical protein
MTPDGRLNRRIPEVDQAFALFATLTSRHLPAAWEPRLHSIGSMKRGRGFGLRGTRCTVAWPQSCLAF